MLSSEYMFFIIRFHIGDDVFTFVLGLRTLVMITGLSSENSPTLYTWFEPLTV